MAITQDDVDYVTDLFEPLSPIKTRKMFGGLSVYSDGQIFALINSTGQLYLKAADGLAKQMEAEGATRFNYAGKSGKMGHMNYWTMPDSAMDDPELAVEWAQKALRAALG